MNQYSITHCCYILCSGKTVTKGVKCVATVNNMCHRGDVLPVMGSNWMRLGSALGICLLVGSFSFKMKTKCSNLAVMETVLHNVTKMNKCTLTHKNYSRNFALEKIHNVWINKFTVSQCIKPLYAGITFLSPLLNKPRQLRFRILRNLRNLFSFAKLLIVN